MNNPEEFMREVAKDLLDQLKQYDFKIWLPYGKINIPAHSRNIDRIGIGHDGYVFQMVNEVNVIDVFLNGADRAHRFSRFVSVPKNMQYVLIISFGNDPSASYESFNAVYSGDADSWSNSKNHVINKILKKLGKTLTVNKSELFASIDAITIAMVSLKMKIVEVVKFINSVEKSYVFENLEYVCKKLSKEISAIQKFFKSLKEEVDNNSLGEVSSITVDVNVANSDVAKKVKEYHTDITDLIKELKNLIANLMDKYKDHFSAEKIVVLKKIVNNLDVLIYRYLR